MKSLILAGYLLALSGLGLFGLLGFVTLWLFYRHGRGRPLQPHPPPPDEWPTVTVQLPTFNERYVIGRLVDAAAALDYPRDKLHIQIVDDSTDETAALAADMVRDYRRRGYHIDLVQRENRTGYKAGALAHATARAEGDLIAIFDADFQPPPHFLRHTVPYLAQNPQLGLVQTRWGHLNHDHSSLTAAQAIIMDKHFAVEQPVSFRADFYPRFNGTAGIWRKQCVQDAGGWRAETVCEDMCLSTRAVLKGWDFEFLPDVITPGELPAGISAYKNQQARWAKGSFQCLLKYGRRILTDRQHPWYARLYALITMSGYLAHPLLLLVLLMQIPLLFIDHNLGPRLMIFSVLGLGQPLLFLLGQQVIHRDWLTRLKHFPTMMMLTIGLGPTITKAVGEAVWQQEHVFVRTPKGEETINGRFTRHLEGYRLPADRLVWIEAALFLYSLIGLGLAVSLGDTGPLWLLGMGVFGYGLILYLRLRE